MKYWEKTGFENVLLEISWRVSFVSVRYQSKGRVYQQSLCCLIRPDAIKRFPDNVWAGSRLS